MSSATMFVIAVLVLAMASIMFVFKTPPRAIQYFKTQEGREVLSGILILTGVGVICAVLFSSCATADERIDESLAHGEIYLGLDPTRDISPQCHLDPNSDRLTSKGSVRARGPSVPK